MGTNDITEPLDQFASSEDPFVQDASKEIGGLDEDACGAHDETIPLLPVEQRPCEDADEFAKTSEIESESGLASGREDARAASQDQGKSQPSFQAHRPHFHLRRWHIIVSAVLLLMIATVCVSGTFFWNRWSRYNDAQDIQGQWYIAGSQVAIDITADQIVFNSNTAYTYTIDSEIKTISFSLGNMDGLAHYCFFENRTVLVIIDGRNYVRWDTAGSDFLLSLEHFALLSDGRIPCYPEGEGIIVLTRMPNKYTWGDFTYRFVDALGAASRNSATAGENAADEIGGFADTNEIETPGETDADNMGDVDNAGDTTGSADTTDTADATDTTGASNGSDTSNLSDFGQFQDINDV